MRLIQVAQRALDLDRAVVFYARLLQADPVAVFDPPGIGFFDLDGVRLLLDVGAPEALIYLGVDDVVQRVEGLRTEGIEIVAEPQVIFRHADDRLGPVGTEEWMGFVRDSEGNTVGLVSQLPVSP